MAKGKRIVCFRYFDFQCRSVSQLSVHQHQYERVSKFVTCMILPFSTLKIAHVSGTPPLGTGPASRARSARIRAAPLLALAHRGKFKFLFVLQTSVMGWKFIFIFIYRYVQKVEG